MMPDAARGHRPLPTVGCREEAVGPTTHIHDRDGGEVPLGTEKVDRPVEAFLGHLEPVLGEFLRLGLRNEVRSRKVGEGYLPCLSVERAAPARPVELLKATREQYLRRRLVGGGELLAFGDERFPAPADVGVVAEISVGACRASPLPPVDA